MFLINSRLGLFTATFSPHVFMQLLRYPFSQSYGVSLPSSLTRVLSLTLGFSPRLPVSVCGTGTSRLARGFSWQCEIRNFARNALPITAQRIRKRICLLPRLAAWTRSTNGVHSLSSCVPPSLKRCLVVQESQPVIHRLRFSASA